MIIFGIIEIKWLSLLIILLVRGIKVIFCITFLRALAAMIITNSHYTGVYPTDLIANGGLLGDVIFFAVSGFCLYDVKMSFGKWYLRRIVRVYPAPIIITAVYMLLGLYNSFEGIRGFFEWFIYPTNYHFVASIIVLYIPFYVVVSVKQLREKISLVFVGVVIIHIIVYVFMYDKSYYHIDTVREPMIRFLFFEAMLIGAYFKNVFDKERDNFKILGGGSEYSIASCIFCFKNAFFESRCNKRISNNKSVCFIGIIVFYYEMLYRNRQQA